MSELQLGQRKPDADEKLYTPLSRLGYELKIHLAKHGEVMKAWGNFVDLLFEQFINKEAMEWKN